MKAYMPHVAVHTRRRFDWIVDPSLDRSHAEWDTVIDANASFVAVPSLGSLVPGWLLAIPRRPLLNLSHLSQVEKNSFQQFVCRLQERLTASFGGVIYSFEHGSQAMGSAMGCGIDQAHLHLVPLSFDLFKAAKDCGTNQMEWHDISASSDVWSEIPSRREYLLIRDSQAQAAIGFPTKPESQWLRKVIAQHLRKSDEWNYKSHSGIENIRLTVGALQNSGGARD